MWFYNSPELHEIPDDIEAIVCTGIEEYADFKYFLKNIEKPITPEIEYVDEDVREYSLFDKSGKLIKEGNSDGYWRRYIYEKNRLIRAENEHGEVTTYTYDDKDRLIKKTSTTGFWITREYDDKGRCVRTRNNAGYEVKFAYDDNNNIIREENSYGRVITVITYTYKDNLLIKKQSNTGVWETYEYDNKGDIIEIKNSFGIDKQIKPEEARYNPKNYRIIRRSK